MEYEFFFSYTRSNNDAYLKRLFKDLNNSIRLKRGLPDSAPVGFFDQRGIELGQDWDAVIVDALQNAKVMLAVASPGYFNSEYCGKEWELFQRRCDEHAKRTGTRAPLLKTIVWVAYAIDALPERVRQYQLLSGDPQAVHNVKGVRYMLQQNSKYRTAYNDYIDKLGDEIIGASATPGQRVSPLLPLPVLSSVRSAFGPAPPAPAPPGAIVLPRLPGPSGPKHVHFVYVAASPARFGAARLAEPYVEEGGRDWRPFYPLDSRRVDPLLVQVAASNDLLFSVEYMAIDDKLIENIDQAWTRRQIVVLVLDPWSVHWDATQANPAYQALLRQLDGRLDYHWCVLVPWNEQDTACHSDRVAIMQTVRNTFDRHARLSPNPMFYRDGIASANELQATLAEVLTRLKEEINKRAVVERPVPLGQPRPTVYGPSVEG
jgi:FxsC-like protein